MSKKITLAINGDALGYLKPTLPNMVSCRAERTNLRRDRSGFNRPIWAQCQHLSAQHGFTDYEMPQYSDTAGICG